MSEFEVAFGTGPTRRFRHPHAVLRAAPGADAAAAWDAADEALRDGYWIAGAVEYEGAIALGVFGAPRDVVVEMRPYAFGGARATVDDARYDAAIATIRRAIYDGDVYQVNYTVPFDFSFDGDPFSLYADLAAGARAPYAAFLRDGERCVVSISPELFLRFDDGRLATRPMKGTAPLDRIDALASPKNRAEHVMIVDLLRNDLHRICTDVRVDALYEVESYPTFATTTSTVSGALAPAVRLADIFDATFPCGSVTGAPKRAAMKAIARLERRPRGAYCGSVGFLAPGRRGWWNVAIRTAQIDVAKGTGRFDAGGGIVADSDARDERREVDLKARFFVERAASIDPIETFAGGDPNARDAHLDRIRACAAYLGRPYDEGAMRERIARVDGTGRMIRIRIDASGSSVAEARDLATPDEPVAICLSDQRVRSDDPMLRWKTTWRPHYDRATAFAGARGCFDALLANERGELTEGARTTLFARVGGALATPPMGAGLLPGILRARLLASGEAFERVLTIADLRAAREIFVGNSARGMLRARLVES